MNHLSDGITEQDRGDGKNYEIGGALIRRDLGIRRNVHTLVDWPKDGNQAQNNDHEEKSRPRAFINLLRSILCAYGKRGAGQPKGGGVFLSQV